MTDEPHAGTHDLWQPLNNYDYFNYKRKNMAKKLILSLDYDGCSDILFCDIFLQNQPHEPLINLLLLLVEQQKFNDLLDNLSNKEEYDTIELRIGSMRQDSLLDNYSANLNKNGICFSNFQKLSLEKQKNNNKWTLNNTLFQGFVDDSKINLITAQLNEAKEKYPEDEIDFYFFDNLENLILSPLTNHFKQNKLHENIHLHLMKFDWWGGICQADINNLREVACIHKGELQPTSTTYFPIIFQESLNFLANLTEKQQNMLSKFIIELPGIIRMLFGRNLHHFLGQLFQHNIMEQFSLDQLLQMINILSDTNQYDLLAHMFENNQLVKRFKTKDILNLLHFFEAKDKNNFSNLLLKNHPDLQKVILTNRLFGLPISEQTPTIMSEAAIHKAIDRLENNTRVENLIILLNSFLTLPEAKDFNQMFSLYNTYKIVIHKLLNILTNKQEHPATQELQDLQELIHANTKNNLLNKIMAKFIGIKELENLKLVTASTSIIEYCQAHTGP